MEGSAAKALHVLQRGHGLRRLPKIRFSHGPADVPAKEVCLAEDDTNALTVNGGAQNFAAGISDSFFDAVASLGFNEEDNAATAPCATDFTGKSAIATRVFNDAVNGFRGDGRKVAFAEGPFLAHQAAGFVPIRLLEGHAHALSDFRNAPETLLDCFFATDLRFEDFPVVDAVLAGFTRVTNQNAALEFIEIDAQVDAMFAAWGQFDGSSAAKSRWVMVLRAGGNVYDNGFGVAADVNPILFALPRSSVAVQGGTNGYGHGT